MERSRECWFASDTSCDLMCVLMQNLIHDAVLVCRWHVGRTGSEVYAKRILVGEWLIETYNSLGLAAN